MRHCGKRVMCLLMSFVMLLTLTVVFTISTTASPTSQKPMIAIGNNFMIVQTASGELWGWGDNSTGVLGTAYSATTGHYITSPTQITLPQGVTSIHISAGYDHVLILGSDGNVYAWGNNEAGQLGRTIDTQFTSTPMVVQGLRGKNIIAVSAGRRFSLALTQEGDVYSFGANNKLQLGYETSAEYSATPTRITAIDGVFIKQINAGDASSLANDTNGDVWLWGSRDNYILGNKDNQKTPILPFALSTIQTVPLVTDSDLSANHSAYLLEDGTMRCFGVNADGQFGNGTESSNASVAFKAIDTSSLHVVDVAVSNFQTVLQTADEKVFCAGDRIPGNADGSATNTFVPLFEEDSQSSKALSIAAAYQNGAVILQDGSVWTWGDNSCGQLGNGTNGTSNAKPTRVLIKAVCHTNPEPQAPTVLGVPVKVTTYVPAPTYAIVIPSTIDVGELCQTDADDPNRYSLTNFEVEATNVANLFGEKEIQVSIQSGTPDEMFCLRDVDNNILPFELFPEETAQTPINSGDVVAKFSKDGSVKTWIRIDQSKITESGIYNGVLIFSYTVENIP